VLGEHANGAEVDGNDSCDNEDDVARVGDAMDELEAVNSVVRCILQSFTENLQAALRAAYAIGPIAEQLTAIAKQIGYFCFLSYDAIIWANTIKFIQLKPETAQRIQKTSFQLWFAGILFSIINSTLKIARLMKEIKRLGASKTWGEEDLAGEAARETRMNALRASRAAAEQQLVVDWLDIWIPATGARLVDVNEGALGIFGFITSLLGVKAQWDAAAGNR